MSAAGPGLEPHHPGHDDGGMMPAADPPLRLLHLTGRTDTGGLFHYVSHLADALHQRGHEVAVAGQLHQATHLFTPKPWPWVEMPLGGGPWRLRRCAAIMDDHLRDHPADLLHVHFRKPMLIARPQARRRQLPLLYTLHLSGIPLGGWRRWLSDWGDHTHVASDDAKQWLMAQANVPGERISVIPHGVDPRKFPLTTDDDRTAARQALGLPPDATIALYVGRFEDPKNEGWMLDLAQADTSANLHVVMVGAGPNLELVRQRVSSSNLAARVHLCPYGDPLPYYRAADALLLPSQIEGFSLVTVEAMSTGLPVLRTRTAGTSETIIENVTGRATAVDHDAFLHAAASFLGDGAALRRLGQAAAAHVRQHLTYDLQVQRTIALYRRMIAAVE